MEIILLMTKILVICSISFIVIYLVIMCLDRWKSYKKNKKLALNKQKDLEDIERLDKINKLIKEVSHLAKEIINISFGNKQDPKIKALLEEKIKERENKQKEMNRLVKEREYIYNDK